MKASRERLEKDRMLTIRGVYHFALTMGCKLRLEYLTDYRYRVYYIRRTEYVDDYEIYLGILEPTWRY